VIEGDFESRIMQITQELVQRHAGALEKSGVTPEIVGITQELGTTREMTIYFWGKADLVDVIEFSVTEDTRAVASEIEIYSWLNEELNALTERLATAERGFDTA
jgi:hypothetical protein